MNKKTKNSKLLKNLTWNPIQNGIRTPLKSKQVNILLVFFVQILHFKSTFTIFSHLLEIEISSCPTRWNFHTIFQHWKIPLFLQRCLKSSTNLLDQVSSFSILHFPPTNLLRIGLKLKPCKHRGRFSLGPLRS